MSIANKILLVDDDSDLLEMVCMALEARQLDVSCVSNGQEVVTAVESVKPDIILMDIYLGNADGRILCQQIKSDPNFRDLPIILYSAGNIEPQSIHDSKADLFIKKPFELSYLFHTIQSLVN